MAKLNYTVNVNFNVNPPQSNNNEQKPFSQTLNDFITSLYIETFGAPEMPKVKFIDYDRYANFEAMVNDIRFNNQLYISTQHCENTIFANPQVNQMFRALHDWIHYITDLSFSYEHELLVNYHQNIVFRRLGLSQFDLDLLNIETAGQIMYHQKTGDFPVNQRIFAMEQLTKLGYELEILES